MQIRLSDTIATKNSNGAWFIQTTYQIWKWSCCSLIIFESLTQKTCIA